MLHLNDSNNKFEQAFGLIGKICANRNSTFICPNIEYKNGEWKCLKSNHPKIPD
jgi:hypothetical protein